MDGRPVEREFLAPVTSEHARRWAEAYSSHAQGYADWWSAVIRPMGQRLLEALPWARARRVLDVGTGTGAHLADIRRMAPGAFILGVDRSAGMLQLARDQHPVPLVLMDAAEIGVRDGSIDVVVLAFVLHHLEDPLAALREAVRVLAPGGAVGTVTWAEEPEFEASRVWEAELEAHGACDPAPLPPSNNDPTNTPEKVADLFLSVGLDPVKIWLERFEHQWDLERLVALRTTFGRSRRKLGSLSVETRTAFLARVRDRLSRLAPPDFLYRAAVVCGVASRRADSSRPLA